MNERLMPAIRELPADAGAGPPATDITYELHGYQRGP
jgi:hypothetical protein